MIFSSFSPFRASRRFLFYIPFDVFIVREIKRWTNKNSRFMRVFLSISFVSYSISHARHVSQSSNIQLTSNIQETRGGSREKRFDSLVTLFRYVDSWNIAASPSLMDVSKNTNVQFHDARSDSGYLLPSLLLEFLRRR